MVITKEEQIEQRRSRVLELSAQGLTQYEIVADFEKMGISISQKTISNDLTALKKDAVEFVKKNREHIAFEYQQAFSNFYQLRKEAWKHFNTTKSEGVKTSLYSILESINNNIMTLTSVGDIIEKEITAEQLQEAAKETKEELQELMNNSNEE